MLEALLDNMRPVVDEFTTKIKDKLVKTSRSHIDQIMELFSVKSKYKRYTKRFSIKQEQFYELTSVPGKNKDFRKNLKYQKYMVDA